MSSTLEQSPYEAFPLPLGGREIRLVKVLPSSSPPVRVQFVCFHLDSCPSYAALSYTWGSPVKNGKILFGPSEITIGDHLFTFLLRVSRNGTKSFFWIDALCINQNDIRERNDQVGLMKDIYSKAQRVIIWLGEASSGDYAAMRLIKEAHRGACTLKNSSCQDVVAGSGKESVLPLYEHEYWTRVWIVQEVIYARKLVMYWGKGTLLWDWLARVSKFSAKDRLYSSPGAIIIRAKAQWKGPVPLADLLSGWFHLRSTDMRDKVFGLLGLASQLEGNSGALQPDYNMVPEQVFHATCDVVFGSNTFSTDEMLVFLTNLRNSLGVPLPAKRLVRLTRLRGSGMVAPEGQSMAPVRRRLMV